MCPQLAGMSEPTPTPPVGLAASNASPITCSTCHTSRVAHLHILQEWLVWAGLFSSNGHLASAARSVMSVWHIHTPCRCGGARGCAVSGASHLQNDAGLPSRLHRPAHALWALWGRSEAPGQAPGWRPSRQAHPTCWGPAGTETCYSEQITLLAQHEQLVAFSLFHCHLLRGGGCACQSINAASVANDILGG